MTATAHIALDGVGRTFRRGERETVALHGIDLEIGRGEFVSVVGPSGCGKSTLLRLVAGLLPASAGQIRIKGQVAGAPRADVGIVFQKPTLVDWRSALGNVLLQAELRRLPMPEMESRARSLLAAVGLGDMTDRYPRELSGGMQQRAAIARALLHHPSMLLMDEPFGALDALTREQMRLDIEALWLRERMTVLFITHAIDEAVLLGDRVVVMTPRPGAIERILPIDMPRPRGLAARKGPAFSRIVGEITDLFLSRGVLDDHAATARLA